MFGKALNWVFEHCLGKKKQGFPIPNPKRFPLSGSRFAASGPGASCWSTYDTKPLGHRRDALRWFLDPWPSKANCRWYIAHTSLTHYIKYVSNISLGQLSLIQAIRSNLLFYFNLYRSHSSSNPWWFLRGLFGRTIEDSLQNLAGPMYRNPGLDPEMPFEEDSRFEYKTFPSEKSENHSAMPVVCPL